MYFLHENTRKIIDVISRTLQLNDIFYLPGFQSLFSLYDNRWIQSLKQKKLSRKSLIFPIRLNCVYCVSTIKLLYFANYKLICSISMVTRYK